MNNLVSSSFGSNAEEERFSMAIDDNEENTPSIYSWGRSDNCTLLATKENESVDGVFAYKSHNRVILQIASNEYHTAALTSNGDVLICGSNEEGQSASDYSDIVIKNPRIYELGNHRITSVSVGLYHTVCVTANGVALSFGGNEVGQTGHSSAKQSKVAPSKVDFNVKGLNALIVSKAVCGDYFSLFLTTTGEVYACGLGSNLGNLKDSNTSIAERIERLVGSNIVSIAAGSSHSLALSSNSELYAWGSNHHGQLGIQKDEHCQTPVLVKLPSNMGKVIGISCGGAHSLVWTDSGVVLGAGSNKYGQLGLMEPRVTQFTVIDNIGDNRMVLEFSLSPSDSSSSADGDSSNTATHATVEKCIQAICGKNHSLVLTNTISQAASSSRLTRSISNSSFVVPSDGEHKLYGFGSNNFGQVDSTNTVSLFRTPTELTVFRQIWNVQKLLYIAAGGDQSFLASAPSGVEENSVIKVMRKQFSTLASRSVTPMSASELLSVLSEAHSNSRMLSVALTTITEIFSSSSLLAASFKSPIKPANTPGTVHMESSSTGVAPAAVITAAAADLSVDVTGVEACYVSLLGLGHAAVVKIMSAFSTTLTSLETLLNISVKSSAMSTDYSAAVSASAVGSENSIPDSILRILLIIWMCPINANAVLAADIFPRLVQLLSRVSPEMRAKITDMLLVFPPHLLVSRILKPLQENLSLIVDSASADQINPTIPLYCLVLNWLYSVTRGKGIIPPDNFYNRSLSNLPDEILLRDFLEYKQFHFNKHQGSGLPLSPPPHRFFLSNHPFLLSAEAKRRILLHENALQQQTAQQQHLTAGYLGAIPPINGVVYLQPWFILTVSRTSLLQTSLAHIARAHDYEFKMPLKVIFEGEEGIDAGGVTKEFFQLIILQLFNPQYGMFCETADGRAMWINKTSGDWSLEEFNLVGVLLGLAVYNGVLLDIHLPKVFYRKLLHRPLSMEDVTSIDPEMAKGLQALLDYSPGAEVEEVFCRNFEVTWDMYGEERTHELIPNGRNVAVTGENRQTYVTNYIQWLLTESIKPQFEQICKGFTKAVNLSSLLLLSPDELELLMVGQPHLDFKELEVNTSYVGDEGWNVTHPTVQFFWKYLHNCSFEDKQKFLLFVTGSSRSPVGGLGKLGLKLQRQGPDSENLPTAHTCFNTLLLPEYGSLEKLTDRLSKAILECEGFGLK